MPNPCAVSRAGRPHDSHSADKAYRRIQVSPEGEGGRGGSSPYRVALAPILVKHMRLKASALFRATFGVRPSAAASAPGRVNLIGEHTDEHTSELQSLAYLVCRLLLEKKKNTRTYNH